MIELNKSLYIAKGAERECYIHPDDTSKLLKVEYNNSIDRNQNKLDIYYYTYLKKQNVSFSHIPKYYGTIETNKGDAVIYDSIKNYDNSVSKSFEEIIGEKKLSTLEEKQLLEELQTYLLTNLIVFGDVVLSNILCQEVSPNHYKLIIIDGLGGRRFGWKLWLHIHSKFYTKFRIAKQWKKLIKNYNLLKKSI